MKADFCVAINGINLDVLVPLFFETFFQVVDTSQLSIHVVDKGVNPEIRDYLQKKKLGARCPFTVYPLPEPFTEETGPAKEKILWAGGDTALTCNWMMNCCGTNNWKIISHFDIEFKKDLIAHIMDNMAPDSGQIGRHNMGMVAINKDAYNQCWVGFQSMSSFHVVSDKHKDHKIRYGDDPRCTDKSIRIEGFDVAELLEMNIQARGWRLDPLPDSVYFSHINHIIAGSGYHGSAALSDKQRQRILCCLKNRNIEAIKGQYSDEHSS